MMIVSDRIVERRTRGGKQIYYFHKTIIYLRSSACSV